MKLFLVFALFLTFTFYASKDTYAATKYVSITGSDTNTGTEESPLRTIQKGADTSDDTVTVLEGFYDERVVINKSGLEFKSRGGKAKMRGFVINADRVSINGFQISTTGEGDDGVGIIVQGNNCKIEDNHIQDSNNVGIKLSNASEGCKTANNKITGIAASATPTIVALQTYKKGDANGDGKVDIFDFRDFWLVNYLKMIKGFAFGDFDNSGKVDGIDYVIWLNNFGK